MKAQDSLILEEFINQFKHASSTQNCQKSLYLKDHTVNKTLIFGNIQNNSKKLKSLKAFIYRLKYDLSFFVFIEFLIGKQHVCNIVIILAQKQRFRIE